MGRLNPPDTLSAENIDTLRSVRRDIYTQGLIGGGIGLCSGIVMYTGAQWARKLGYIKAKSLNPNTGMLVVLSSFAFGTFFMASTAGKEVVHTLYPVFRAGWVEPQNDLNLPKLDYNQKIKLSKENNSDEGTTTAAADNNNNNNDTIPVDPQQLREMRVVRRKSLMETLQNGRGISDSHSGRWVEENSETKFEKE